MEASSIYQLSQYNLKDAMFRIFCLFCYRKKTFAVFPERIAMTKKIKIQVLN